MFTSEADRLVPWKKPITDDSAWRTLGFAPLLPPCSATSRAMHTTQKSSVLLSWFCLAKHERPSPLCVYCQFDIFPQGGFYSIKDTNRSTVNDYDSTQNPRRGVVALVSAEVAVSLCTVFPFIQSHHWWHYQKIYFFSLMQCSLYAISNVQGEDSSPENNNVFLICKSQTKCVLICDGELYWIFSLWTFF